MILPRLLTKTLIRMRNLSLEVLLPSENMLPVRNKIIILFATEEDAMKVAERVIKKIRNNDMPPTVTIEELRELEVL